MPGSFVKLQFEEGEIDFVAAPNLLTDAWEVWDIAGHSVRVETAAEVIAKKMFHRGDHATARDLFDLALVIEREPQQLASASEFLVRHRQSFLDQIRQPRVGLRARFEAIATLAYRPTFERCVEVAHEFLAGLQQEGNDRGASPGAPE